MQGRLQILIQGMILAVLLAAQTWVSHEFEDHMLRSAEVRTVEIADGAINGLNTLMDVVVNVKDVISDEKARAHYIHQIGNSDSVKELRIVRAKGTNDEFGPGLPEEQPVDALDREVLADGKPRFKMSDHGEGALRAVIPLIAMKEFRSSKCLRCHGVDEGTVLGAASVIVDVKDELTAIARFNLWVWVGQGAVQVLLFFVIAWIVRRTLNKLGAEPGEAAQVAKSVAEGDLSQAIRLKPGDTDSLMAQLESMKDSLSRVVGTVRQRAEGVATASVQIAQGNSDLSARAEQQASALQQTAASMEALGTQVKQKAGSASQANNWRSTPARWLCAGARRWTKWCRP